SIVTSPRPRCSPAAPWQAWWPAQDRARPAAVVARARIVGLTLESLIATLDGVAIVGLVDEHRASAQIGADVVGIEADCPVIVAHRAVVVVLLAISIAATHEEVGLLSHQVRSRDCSPRWHDRRHPWRCRQNSDC